jgi:hypothetical protein
MTLETFVQIVNGRCPTGWRRGQFVFNTLHDMRPSIANAIRDTELDPFHHDERIPATLAYISETWGDL